MGHPRIPQAEELMNTIDSRLRELLLEQYNFLSKSCKEFDNGDKSEAKRIAVCLRVLAHSTKKSTSLLSQLEDNLNIRIKILSRNMGFMPGLVFYVGASIRNHEGVQSYVPMMDISHPGLRELAISDWWNQGLVIVDGIQFTRKDLMLTLANKEGGAHVDPLQHEDFRRLTEGDLIKLISEEGEKVKDLPLVLARENGFFMMKCIEDNFKELVLD